MGTLTPFILEHHTMGEGGTTKVHIQDWERKRVLCGLNPDNHPFSSGTTQLINREWLNQPDADGALCQRCRKSALKLLQSFEPVTP